MQCLRRVPIGDMGAALLGQTISALGGRLLNHCSRGTTGQHQPLRRWCPIIWLHNMFGLNACRPWAKACFCFVRSLFLGDMRDRGALSEEPFSGNKNGARTYRRMPLIAPTFFGRRFSRRCLRSSLPHPESASEGKNGRSTRRWLRYSKTVFEGKI